MAVKLPRATLLPTFRLPLFSLGALISLPNLDLPKMVLLL